MYFMSVPLSSPFSKYSKAGQQSFPFMHGFGDGGAGAGKTVGRKTTKPSMLCFGTCGDSHLLRRSMTCWC